MSAAVLDSHPTLTAVLFGLYEREPGVFVPISYEDRLTAVQILADRLDPPAPAPYLTSNVQWFLPMKAVEYEEVLVPPFKPPSPELLEYVKTFTIIEERYAELFGFGEPPCRSEPPTPSCSPTAESTPEPVVRYLHRTTCEHGIDTLFRCGQCILEGKQK